MIPLNSMKLSGLVRAVTLECTFKLMAFCVIASVMSVSLSASEIIDHTDVLEVTYSTQINDGEAAIMVFDDTTSTKWLTASGNPIGWIAIDFLDDAYIVDSYTLSSANDAPDRTPKDWELQGSNDGQEWVTIAAVTDETGWTTFETRSYSCDNTQAYSMYRLDVTANNGSTGLMGISELELFADGVDITSPSLIVTVDSQISDKESVVKLIDNTTSTKWLANKATAVMEFQFPARDICSLNGYVLYSCNDYPTRDPKSWTFYGSNDGQNWDILDSRSGETWSARYAGNTYAFDNSTEYIYYKFDFTENAGDRLIGISEVELLQIIDDPEITTVSPDNYSTITGDSVTLSWDDARETANATYNFYFAEDPNDFGSAASYTLTGITDKEVTIPESFIIDDTVYCWQVDIVDDPYGNGTEVYAGDLNKLRVLREAEMILEWNMDDLTNETVYSYEMPIEGISVAASSQENANTGPEHTIDGSGMTLDKTISDPNGLIHGNAVHSMWISSPEQEEGDIWIQYDFDQDYAVGKMHIWNHNIGGDYVAELDRGMKNVIVSYAIGGTDAADPNNWTELGEYTIPMGTGQLADPDLEIDFAGLVTSAVKITAAAEDSNWGGAGTYHALSEVRFGKYDEPMVRYYMKDTSLNGNNAYTYYNASQDIEAITGSGLNLNLYGTMYMEREDKGDNETVPLGKDYRCNDAWSFNFYSILQEKAASLSFFVGFGDYDLGTGRYIAQFADGIHFWGGNNVDAVTNVDFDINRWQMITVTYDSSVLRIYKNAVNIFEGAVDFQMASPNVFIGGATPWGDTVLNGIFDNFTMYRGKLSDDQIAALKSDMPIQYSAINPVPATGSENVGVEPILQWDAPLDAFNPTFTVYLSTDGEEYSAIASELTETKYDLLGSELEYGTTYYWYVDTSTGDLSDVWTFTTLPGAAKSALAFGWDFDLPLETVHTFEAAVENVVATASSYEIAATGRMPDRAVNGLGLFIDPAISGENAMQHTNNTTFTWISEPQAAGEQWIKFAFDDSYELGTMHIWNHNVSEAYIEELDRGMQDVIVYYGNDDSLADNIDPNDWTKLGEYTIPKGTGENNMTPSIGIDFAGKTAKFVMIKGDGDDSNYGAENNYHALSEVRFGINGTTAVSYSVADTSGNGNAGMLYNSPEFVNGIGSGQAIKIENNNAAVSGLHDYIEADIVSPESLPFAKGDTWSMNIYLYLDYVPESLTMFAGMGGIPEGTGRFIGQIGDNARFWGGNNLDVSSSTPYNSGHWQMVTVTYTGSLLSMYLDGELIGTNVNPSNVNACSEYITIGGISPWGGGRYAQGLYDDFSVYNGVLTRSEIAELAARLPDDGDFNTDDIVDVADMAIFADYWLVEGDQICPADFTGDTNVTLEDFAVMAANWLKTN